MMKLIVLSRNFANTPNKKYKCCMDYLFIHVIVKMSTLRTIEIMSDIYIYIYKVHKISTHAICPF